VTGMGILFSIFISKLKCKMMYMYTLYMCMSKATCNSTICGLSRLCHLTKVIGKVEEFG
jgi:hypothetical protein